MKKIILLIILILVFIAGMAWVQASEGKLSKEKVEVQIKEVDDKSVTKKAEEWFQKGVEASKTNNYDEAIKCFKKAIAIDPNNAAIHYNLGITYYDKGMLDEAITEYKKTIAINPNYIDAHYNLGFTYMEKEMFDEAIVEFKKVIAIDFNSADAHHNLGYSYLKKGLNSMAADHLYRAGLLHLEQGNKVWAFKAYEDLKLTNSKELEQDLYKKLPPEVKRKKSFLDKVFDLIR